ncbi:MAG: hypothetical protein Q7R70_01770 [Candidatus Diapherotrites archaeon]|nr:hypothetical protein [Candidatus Diapherotrites archaeon]
MLREKKPDLGDFEEIPLGFVERPFWPEYYYGHEGTFYLHFECLEQYFTAFAENIRQKTNFGLDFGSIRFLVSCDNSEQSRHEGIKSYSWAYYHSEECCCCGRKITLGDDGFTEFKNIACLSFMTTWPRRVYPRNLDAYKKEMRPYWEKHNEYELKSRVEWMNENNSPIKMTDQDKEDFIRDGEQSIKNRFARTRANAKLIPSELVDFWKKIGLVDSSFKSLGKKDDFSEAVKHGLLFSYATDLAKKGNSGEAFKIFDKIFSESKIDSLKLQVLYRKACFLYSAGKLDEAKACLDVVLKIEPAFFGALKLNGVICASLGKEIESLEYFLELEKYAKRKQS